MNTKSFFLVFLLVAFLCASCKVPPAANGSLPKLSEACAVLQNFKGEYSYGGLGLVSESNDGEVAAWTIYHSPEAAQHLVQIFPHCGPSGQAYALAVLYHLDKVSFRSLTNDFCSVASKIDVASGCILSDVSRPELIKEMQRSRSTLAFHPSQPPRRRGPLGFRGDHYDVYESDRRYEEKLAADAARGLEESHQPQLSAVTDLFRVEEAKDEGSGPSGEWRAHLLPKKPFRFQSMVEATFAKTNGLVELKIAPPDLLNALKEAAEIPFLNTLDRESGVAGVRVRVEADRLHWETEEVLNIEKALKSNVPLKDWVQIIVDLGPSPHDYVELFHPMGTDIYVVEGGFKYSPAWRKQYRKLTGKRPDEYQMRFGNSKNDRQYPVVNGAGDVRLVPVVG